MVNDVSILAVLLLVMLVPSIVLPLLALEMGDTSHGNNYTSTVAKTTQQISNDDSTSAWKSIKLYFKLFKAGFPYALWWLVPLGLVIFLIGAFVLLRNIWIGGGG